MDPTPPNKPRRIIFFILVPALLVVGIAIGWFLPRSGSSSTDTTIRLLREPTEPGSLIEPLLGFSPAMNTDPTYLSLHDQLTSLINNRVASGDLKRGSVYLRDMETGNWTAINDNEVYAPASLLKVPIMMAYYTEAETNPAVLQKQLTYNGETNVDQYENIKAEQPLAPGTYSVDTLIDAMIKASSNNATNLLFNNLPTKDQTQIYTDLQMKPVNFSDTSDQMNVRYYARFFRVLFNATYLNDTYSEKALELLTQAEYRDGLVAGVPSSIKVAHKFGERKMASDDERSETSELHDCGIVYYPDHPYLLCVMTEGTDLTALQNVIQAVSRTVYGAISTRYPTSAALLLKFPPKSVG